MGAAPPSAAMGAPHTAGLQRCCSLEFVCQCVCRASKLGQWNPIVWCWRSCALRSHQAVATLQRINVVQDTMIYYATGTTFAAGFMHFFVATFYTASVQGNTKCAQQNALAHKANVAKL